MLTVDRNKIRRRPVTSSAAPSTSGGSALFTSRNGTTKHLSLIDKDFVLDIEDHRQLQHLTTEIEKLGGRVVSEICEDKKPFCVVSDSVHMAKVERLKPEQITPQMLKCLPMLIRDAIRLRIRYRSCKVFAASLDKLKHNIKNDRRNLHAPSKRASTSSHRESSTHASMLQLQPPYLKLEDNRGAFAPLYKQFTAQSPCHKIYLGKHMGRSLFHRNHHPDTPKAEKSPTEKQKLARQPLNGYCEICCKKYENNKEHFASREHTMSVSQPGIWTAVDSLCGSFLDYVSSNHQKKHRTQRRPTPPSPTVVHY